MNLTSYHTQAPEPMPASPECPTAQNIVWIASYPKSGNTWVRVLLENLSREMTEPSSEAADINRLSETAAWDIRGAPYAKLLGKPVNEASHREIAGVRPMVQAEFAASRPGPLLVKTHLCVGQDHRFATINLEVTLAAINIVRNPLDVAISYAHHSAVSIDGMIAAMATPGFRALGNSDIVHEVLGSWSRHVASWLGINNRPVHVLRYEDLHANPVRTLAALARFLGLEPADRGAIAPVTESLSVADRPTD